MFDSEALINVTAIFVTKLLNAFLVFNESDWRYDVKWILDLNMGWHAQHVEYGDQIRILTFFFNCRIASQVRCCFLVFKKPIKSMKFLLRAMKAA